MGSNMDKMRFYQLIKRLFKSVPVMYVHLYVTFNGDFKYFDVFPNLLFGIFWLILTLKLALRANFVENSNVYNIL